MNQHQQQNLEQLLNMWQSALEAYGTPSDFTACSRVQSIPNPDNPDEAAWTIIYSEGFHRRKELMKEEQKKLQEEKQLQGEKKPFLTSGKSDENSSDQDPCLLCPNVVRAQSQGANLLLPWETFQESILAPNRYPAITAHCLLIQKQHDPTGRKISGAVTSAYLENLMQVAKDYGVAAFRNHRLAGMSIPNHEHAHLYPREWNGEDESIPAAGIFRSSLEPTPFGNSIYKASSSRFDTIVLRGHYAAEGILSVMGKMEDDSQIFTFAHDDEKFFLTPHRKDGLPDAYRQYGSSTGPLYLKVVRLGQPFSFQDHIADVERFHWVKSTFPWEKYF